MRAAQGTRVERAWLRHVLGVLAETRHDAEALDAWDFLSHHVVRPVQHLGRYRRSGLLHEAREHVALCCQGWLEQLALLREHLIPLGRVGDFVPLFGG